MRPIFINAVATDETHFEKAHSPTPPEIKKPLEHQRLKVGAGEEGRTPDLMLGKHTL
jgi:hypothetical protein